jgi:hypothetical protein
MSTYNVNQEDGLIREECENGRPKRVSFLDVFAGIVGFETSFFPIPIKSRPDILDEIKGCE